MEKRQKQTQKKIQKSFETFKRRQQICMEKRKWKGEEEKTEIEKGSRDKKGDREGEREGKLDVDGDG